VTGIGRFNGQTVALVGHQKGRDIRERTHRNFG
jgi:acetyl-CoA carboxylase carboxyl transferase subunit alpha